ncbi:Zn-dependent alcohol dehydrogenase [Candidatus Nitrososphaera evergladensis SR1]|jgi:propanol-preferring alcohol dehydrogenase|uniref:Zn-dependent alcohol dehydrogenase n=1 Tax=Candidatus Nitrososphaera evergladensis SR1 TaxID=1459636 RepID=A0A075N0J4_9ARCH|nr:alcohol dehydrogenase catalytic domain-containing protein [Candidatus Nitrososphaera evergladensis]AIF85004.1 Zn-dependent alcohol dehydrogenase [Candidatus Nitrososphaera evergladensis SR1]
MAEEGTMTMKAMVLDRCAPIETKPLKLKSIPVPKPKKRGEVLLEIETCGVCRSNLHMIEGDWKDEGSPSVLPVVPGHEVVGVVKKADGARKVKEGDRVGIQPLFSSCLKCGYCNSGKEHLCDDAEITGESVQGGYAEYIVADEEFVTAIPDSIDSAHAAPLFCPGITAYKAVKASEPARGRSVGIFGIGGVGHLAIQMAKMEGARVVGISRAKKHLDLAKKLGADSTVAYQDSTDQFLKNLKKEEGLLDSAIVFAPSEKAIDAAIKSVKKGGLVVVGVVGEIPHFSAFEEKTIRGTVIGSRQDMADLVALAAGGSLEVVIETHKLAEANDVLARLKHSEVEARAVLVP